MDRRLVEALCDERPPFDGITLKASRDLSSTDLLLLQRALLAWLKRQPSQQLTILEDWCFHDGTVFEGEPISLAQLEAMCRDEDTVTRLSDDTLVSTAVYPEDMGFYWRWGMRSDGNEVPFRGSFDFTASEETLNQIELPTTLLDVLVRLPANEFFANAHLPLE